MLDSDLANIYGVSTKRLNEQFRRNKKRFPVDFAFQLERQEFATLRSQIATSKEGSGRRQYRPWVFTEHGAIMLASVLNSPVAIEASVGLCARSFICASRFQPIANFRGSLWNWKSALISTMNRSRLCLMPFDNCWNHQRSRSAKLVFTLRTRPAATDEHEF